MKLVLLVLVFALLLVSSCERGMQVNERTTKVTFKDDNPPTFLLSGSGQLGDLVIYGPKQREVSSDRSFALWEIEPINGFLSGRAVDDIGSIKYGVIPEGYKQVYPEKGAAPPNLVAEEKYEYWFQIINAPHARAYFTIRNNQAVELPK